MHPTFVELFLQDGAEDLLAEEDKRRTARARRTRSRRAAKVTVRARDRRPRAVTSALTILPALTAGTVLSSGH
jgi:hypothetical protein